ncbi:MAG: hypothetical protein AAFQ71_03070 [Planctomycetota bacterium]
MQNLATPSTPATGTVRATRICTRSKKAAGWVRHVEIDVSGTPLAGRFRAGQSFGVLPPGEGARGKPHKLRLYSIASPTAGEDGEGGVLATTVKRLIDEHWDDHTLYRGVASNYLCDLKEGDEVAVTGPAGKRFLLPGDAAAHDYVFFATGTGIAPFRGMLGDLVAGGFPSRATLVMGAPYESDLLYHDELTALSSEQAGFRYVTALSRQPQTIHEGPASLYVQDRLLHDPHAGHADSLSNMLKSPRTLVYVCGIAGMELGIFRRLAETLPPEQLAEYLEVSPEAGDPEAWTRRMINRQIKPTKRVFLEVY